MNIFRTILKKITGSHIIKNISNSDMYNTDIFKYGVINLLEEYKVNLMSSNAKDTDIKLKEIEFHLTILKNNLNNN